jgi:hypothetical protein
MSADTITVFPVFLFDATHIAVGTLMRFAKSVTLMMPASDSSGVAISIQRIEMSCCDKPKEPLTKADFLKSKLQNFRAFVEPHCATDEQRAALKNYDTVEAVMPLLLQAVAAQRVGQSEAMLAKFCSTFPTADDAFKAKVARYLGMFCEVLTT